MAFSARTVDQALTDLMLSRERRKKDVDVSATSGGAKGLGIL